VRLRPIPENLYYANIIIGIGFLLLMTIAILYQIIEPLHKKILLYSKISKRTYM